MFCSSCIHNSLAHPLMMSWSSIIRESLPNGRKCPPIPTHLGLQLKLLHWGETQPEMPWLRADSWSEFTRNCSTLMHFERKFMASMQHPQQFRAHLSSAQSNQAISSDFESKQRKASGQSSTKNAPWAELSCWRFQTPSYQWSSVIIANSTRNRVGVHLWCTSEIVSVLKNWMRLSRNFGKHWGHGPNAQPQMMNQTCVKTCLKRAILTVKPRLDIHESDRVLQL